MPKQITIIGGGLAGLTLGIGLRRRGIPVTVLEAGHYPRHRVCGEFISGCGQQTLANLGLLDLLLQSGAVQAGTAAFFPPGQSNPPIRRLEQKAICISRFRLDSILAETFRAAGGELRENTRADLSDLDEGTIRASGRRAHPIEDGYSWFGVKIHARNFPLVADLEMHACENGYVGLCRLPGNEVNICGLFRRASQMQNAQCKMQNENKTPAGRLLVNIPSGSRLYHRLSSAETDEASFCSVAGLSLKPQRAAELPDCSLGDSLTMTPPVTGNGMSMAFESAELALGALCAYACGELSWRTTKDQIGRVRRSLRLPPAMGALAAVDDVLSAVSKLSGRSGAALAIVWNMFFRRTRRS